MRIRIVDAFTDRPFAGNPAGVVILDGDVPCPSAAFGPQSRLRVIVASEALAAGGAS